MIIVSTLEVQRTPLIHTIGDHKVSQQTVPLVNITIVQSLVNRMTAHPLVMETIVPTFINRMTVLHHLVRLMIVVLMIVARSIWPRDSKQHYLITSMRQYLI